MSSSNKDTAVIAYVASPHAGYLKLFRKYEGAWLYILGRDLQGEFPELVRHLPGVGADEASTMISALGIFHDVRILWPSNIPMAKRFKKIVMPDEVVARALTQKYFADVEVTFDDSWKLRWDWGTASANKRPEGEVTISRLEFDQRMMCDAILEARKSSDWWRQIGAVLVKDVKILFTAYNQHLPSEQSAYVEGDPRSSFAPGERIDVSLALHAEMNIIAQAARAGVSTEGCDLYVTTFPCPPCANACASIGLKRLYYYEGYSLVAGAESLRSRGVEIIRV